VPMAVSSRRAEGVYQLVVQEPVGPVTAFTPWNVPINGVTVDEIKAARLHATAYCGIPAGLDAFRAAHEVLTSEGVLGKK
jgi:hypothetical protein